jgi:oligopeptide transport system permease protein
MRAIAVSRSRVFGSATVRTSLSVLGVIALAAIIAPLLSPHDLVDIDFDAQLLPPSATEARWFGTDDLGRDLLVRTFSGTRITLLVAVVASMVSLCVGVAWGAVAGYAGGKVDAVMMRIVDALYALPFIFLESLLMVAFDRNFLLIFVAIGAINWLDMARIVRGQTLSIKHREFIDAARLTGV